MMRIVWPMLLGLLFLAGQDAYAQEPMVRVYANTQSWDNFLAGNVSDPEDAVDQDLTTFSSLTVTVAGTVYQQLNFPETAPTGTPLRIKIGTASDILSLLNNVQVRAYNGGTAVGSSVSLSSLVSLIAGEDQDEIVFIPPGPYNRVRVSTGGIALGGGLRIYEAYFYKPTTSDIACDLPIDILYGSTGNIGGGLNAVTTPYYSVDGNINTAATIRANVSALNETHITALYPTASSSGDSIYLVVKNPGGLLDLTLLASNFTVKTYLDNQDNGVLELDPSFLRLRLLPGSNDKQIITYPVSQPFNRLKISLGLGLVNALGSLEVYEIGRLAVGPDINETNAENLYFSCAGEPVTLTIESPESGATYKWYNESGALIYTGTTFEPSLLETGDNIFYVSKSRQGCLTESGRTIAIVRVTATALPADITVNDAAECEGNPVELTPTSGLTNPVYTWYKDINKTEVISDGDSDAAISYAIDANGKLTITGLPGGTDINYYVAVSGDEKCENAAGELKPANVKITAAAVADDIIIDDEIICEGASASLSPNSSLTDPVYRWYRNANKTGQITDGSSDGPIGYDVASDGTLTISNLEVETNYTYYLSVEGTDRCENLSGNLKEVVVSVHLQPEQPDITLLD